MCSVLKKAQTWGGYRDHLLKTKPTENLIFRIRWMIVIDNPNNIYNAFKTIENHCLKCFQIQINGSIIIKDHITLIMIDKLEILSFIIIYAFFIEGNKLLWQFNSIEVQYSIWQLDSVITVMAMLWRKLKIDD